jgi:hypothetical protein
VSPEDEYASSLIDHDCVFSVISHLIPSGIRNLVAMEAPAALTNVSSYLPSAMDLLMVIPRLFTKANSLGDLVWSGGSVIAEPTQANLTNSTAATTAGQFIQESVAAAASAASGLAGTQDDIGIFQALKNVASFFSYITSKWAIATFAIVSHLSLLP